MIFKNGDTAIYEEIQLLGKCGFAGGYMYKVVNKTEKDSKSKRNNRGEIIDDPSKFFYALKAIHNPTKIKTYEIEAENLKAFSRNPYIIKYIEVFFFNPFTCIISSYYEKDLRKVLEEEMKKGQALDDNKILKWSMECLKGLQELHQNNIIHRNIKPE